MDATVTEDCTDEVRGNIVTLTSDCKRYRNFCTALFQEDKPKYCEKTMKFLCYAPEECPSTGRHHWQLFVCFKNARTITAACTYLKELWATPVMLKVCKGTPTQNAIYCGREDYECKDKKKVQNDLYEEHGTLPVQGARTDLVDVCADILSGVVTVNQLVCKDPYFFHQYGRTLDRIEDRKNASLFRTEQTKGIWYWGPTGCGKSHVALQDFSPSTHYIVSMQDYPWMDMYTGQPTVVINDYRTGIAFSELLQMVDKWPYYVRRRCRAPTAFLAKLVIVTSSLPPKECYNNVGQTDSINQLLRRFKVVHMPEANYLK